MSFKTKPHIIVCMTKLCQLQVTIILFKDLTRKIYHYNQKKLATDYYKFHYIYLF
jgi:hypothetical protein